MLSKMVLVKSKKQKVVKASQLYTTFYKYKSLAVIKLFNGMITDKRVPPSTVTEIDQD